MDWQDALRARILAAPPVAALVGNRVNWSTRPQRDPWPCLVLTLISDPWPVEYAGLTAFRESRVQVDVMAMAPETVRAIRSGLIPAIHPPVRWASGVTIGPCRPVNVTDRTERSSAGDTVFREQIDFLIWHN